MPRSDCHIALFLALGPVPCFLALTAPVAGQVPPDYDFQWSTIGSPGNRPANELEAPRFYPPLSIPAFLAGAVGYEYRLTRTEVTVGQWFEFINAYWPHYQGRYDSAEMTSYWIGTTSTVPGQNPGYTLLPQYARFPIATTWNMAARYTNWLGNGKGSTAAAFETGAYDTSTFVVSPNGSWNSQPTRTPGSTFWIPSTDEWTKGMFYDPSRYGPGQEGYWRYPNGGDTPLTPGWPGEGGQTSAGLEIFSGPWLDVMSYPDVQSPWGLWDGSGSQTEWTEFQDPDRRVRGVMGTRQYSPNPEFYDRVDWLGVGLPGTSLVGFRVASAVPGPSGLVVGLMMAFPLLSTRRRK